MQFSSRTRQLAFSPSLAMLDRVRALRAQGHEVINFGARPDAPSAAKAAAKAFLDAGGASAYTPTRGLPELRVAIARKLEAENALRVDPQAHIVVTVGAKQAVYAALLALVDAGDEVLIEDPGWLGFAPIVTLSGATPVPIALHERDDFHIAVDAIQARLGPRTRVLVICNPHNPTGALLTRSELEAIARLARDNDLVVIVDEAYERLVYDGREHVSLAALDGMWERTITVQTCSKIYNMGGWRVGWITGPTDAIERIAAIQSSVITCPTSFAQAGVAAALGQPVAMGDESVTELLERFALQRDAMVEGLRAIPGVTCANPAGGFFAFPNFSAYGLSSAELCAHLLDRAGVATTPGSAFGTHGESHLRVLFTSPLEEIRVGLGRLTQALAELRHAEGAGAHQAAKRADGMPL